MSTTCDEPRCDQPAAWTCRDGKPRCTAHAIDRSPLTAIPVPPRPADPPPVDAGILAAICPPGWRRSPNDGRPVMPLVGRLLFPGDADGLPTLGDMQRQMNELYDYTESLKPCWVSLIQCVIGDAMHNRRNGREGLSQATEHALSQCIDAVLRFRGEVRIRKTATGGWKEVGDG